MKFDNLDHKKCKAVDVWIRGECAFLSRCIYIKPDRTMYINYFGKQVEVVERECGGFITVNNCYRYE